MALSRQKRRRRRGTYLDIPASFAFPEVDGGLQVLDGTAWVAQLSAANSRISSLLGWDSLRQFRLEARPAEGIVRLQRE